MEFIEEYNKKKLALDNEYRGQIIEAIKTYLAKMVASNITQVDLGKISLNENEYDDTINAIDADGKSIVYNTWDCLDSCRAYDEPVSFDDFSIKTQINILENLSKSFGNVK